jgi:hypothetical protein
MRVLWPILIAALAAFPPSARAQQGRPSYFDMLSPPIAPTDMANYCVYENRVYSIGAGLCIGRTSYACVPSTGPATGNRSYWASGKEDQMFPRPVCN